LYLFFGRFALTNRQHSVQHLFYVKCDLQTNHVVQSDKEVERNSGPAPDILRHHNLQENWMKCVYQNLV